MENIFRSLRELFSRHSQINWALADQAIVSGVNFLTGILLARYLGLHEFGVFTLAWMAVMFVNSLQYALIISPMMSIGPKQPEEQIPAYFGFVHLQQITFGLFSFVLILIGIWLSHYLFPSWRTEHLALPLACSSFAYQTQEYLRRYFFTRKRPVTAFINDIAKYGGQIILLLSIFYSGNGSVVTMLWVIAVTSFLAAIFGIMQIEYPTWPSAVFFKDSFMSHLRFSKWLVASVFTRWISRNLFIVAAGAALGSSAAGALKAAQNMLGTTHIMFMGLDNVVPVKASHIYIKDGLQGLTRYLKKVAIFVGVFTVLIALVFSVPAQFWLVLFYGDQFASYTELVRWYGVIYVFMALTLPLEVGLRTLENTSPIFWSWGIVSLFSLATSAHLVALFGINGAALGILLSVTIQVSVLSFGFYKAGRKYWRIHKMKV